MVLFKRCLMFAWSIHLPADSAERIYSFASDDPSVKRGVMPYPGSSAVSLSEYATFTKAAMKVILWEFPETIHSTGMPKCHEGDRLCQ